MEASGGVQAQTMEEEEIVPDAREITVSTALREGATEVSDQEKSVAKGQNAALALLRDK